MARLPWKRKDPPRRRTKDVVVVTGLGTAVRRLMELQARYSRGLDQDGRFAVERELLTDALNRIPVTQTVKCFPDQMPEDFDLDGDGSVSFYEYAAVSGCCRADLKAADTPTTATDKGSALLPRRRTA